ncbi:MAG: DUF58 domain-containing protein [Candidatus Wallbacteria bacterium HGW-Wallbacteria-1]|uniref:DUF58 domain-containing protein n=1 Tax=Candidatus Wallbacteria bacterium HGW-Wallbacteria-1 TaxID=2013854 RepID=A0A2N1PLH7_9BACT|nr:MAG: DUF58 domain-containing protein [Candidatus Wallbacteria bacterium HGW-Wallbacteria-1]
MLTRELIKKIRRIEITTSHLVEDLFSGEYHSIFKGRGMEFAEVREYQRGDDVRTIDWNVTARMNRPFVKQFCEERELTVMLMVDASSSEAFGTHGMAKAELAAEICALLAFSAIKNNDRVGLMFFTDGVEKYIPPKKGKQHVIRVIREVLCFSPRGRGTDIAQALAYLNRVTTRRCVVFLLSDFMSGGYEKDLMAASRRHDITTISLADRREEELPDVGLVNLMDAETGEEVLVDTSDPQVREVFARLSARDRQGLKRSMDGMKVGIVRTRTDQGYVNPLVAYFRKRSKKR